MKRLIGVIIVCVLSGAAHAERVPWYRGFYTRVGIRDSIGAQEPFHAWAAFAFGLGYRYSHELWGIDASALNVQFDPEEGMHTAGRIVPFVNFERWTRADLWLGTGLSYGWVKGTVDQAIAKRRGQGWQAELIAGAELPRQIMARMFVQSTLTLPLYNTYDIYKSRDSELYVYAVEIALGIRL